MSKTKTALKSTPKATAPRPKGKGAPPRTSTTPAEPRFPTTEAELDRLSETRADRWRLLDTLESLERERPLTDDERRTGQALCGWLLDDMALLQEPIAELIHDCLERPDPSTWAAAGAAWCALDVSDQIHLHDVFRGMPTYLKRFRKEPGEGSDRVRCLRAEQAREVERALELVARRGRRTGS